MMRNLRSFCLLLFVFLICFRTLGTETTSVFFENYSEDQGLVHSHVLCMYQDSRGIMWVGTYGGVQEFNGYTFNKFNISGKKSNILTNHVVNVVYEDKDRNIWFGTESGLNKYNPESGELKQYLHDKNNPKSLSNNNIRTIYQDEAGIFWIGTYGGGLNSFDERKNIFQHYRVNGNSYIKSDLVNAFFVDKDGLFWVGTENGGVAVFDKTKADFVQCISKEAGSLNHAIVSVIYQDNKDNYWIGTWGGGLNKYNPKTGKFSYFTNFSTSVDGKKGNIVTSILQTENDFLWISSFGEGLYKFDLKNETFTKININSVSEGNSSQEIIWTLSRDNDNNVWLGTFGKGIFRENNLKNTFPYYTLKQEGDLKLSISSIVEDKLGKLWIGTLNRGIYIYNLQNQAYSKFNSGSLQIEHISKIYIDSKDRMWVGSNNVLYMLYPDRKRVRRFAHDPAIRTSISESEVNAVFEDSEGNIWIGFWGTGIEMIRKEELEKKDDASVVFTKFINGLDDTTSFNHNRIWKFFEDSKHIIWIGTSGDLAYYNLDEREFKTLPIRVASSFYEDQFGNLWIGSIGYGLYKLDKSKQIVKKYTTEDGLPTLDILAIQKDKKGRLWLGTSAGLTLFDPRSDNISNFDKNYGLKHFSISHNACTSLSNGQLIFGGNNGFNIFKAEDVSQDFSASPIIISDIKVNNKSVLFENVTDSAFIIKTSSANLDTLLLSYKDKVFTLEFAAVNYSIPSSITYAYMLEGFDEDWVMADANNRSATYTNLDEGEYVFRVKMAYSKGKWTESPRKLRIIITPPFWKQIWFKILMTLAAFGIIWFLLWIRLGRNKLAMIINQKQYITEKLTTEQELLQMRYEQLKETLNQYNKKNASISLNYQSIQEYLNSFHRNLLEIKNATPNLNNSKFNQLVKGLGEKVSEMSESVDFNENVNMLYDDFVKRFAESYPKLTATDIRICSLIRMNKSNKDIAKQLNITLGSLETSRHRIRKKINLPTDTNLNDFILRF